MKQKKKISFSFIHMGAPSLLMIFLVLCLFTFALLSLSSAKNNRTLSQQSADRIQAYYQASSLAEQALDQIDTILSDKPRYLRSLHHSFYKHQKESYRSGRVPVLPEKMPDNMPESGQRTAG